MHPAWALLPLAVALLLASAKAHGRQVRLEREHAGYPDVRFGAPNPPFVEALWRRDRRRFWTTAPLAALALLAGLLVARPAWPVAASALLGWAPTAGFALTGALSARALARAMRERAPDAAWRRAAVRGSWAWWGLAGALLLATLLAALLP